jgi:hypothetical protein
MALVLALVRRFGANATLATVGIFSTAVIILAAGCTARALQDCTLVGATKGGQLQSTWLCLWPTAQGMLAQLSAAVIALGVLTFLALSAHRRASES